MSATAFLIARKGDSWRLHETGIPVNMRREFKRLHVEQVPDVEELRYFDTYGHSKRKRFKDVIETEYTGDTEKTPVAAKKGKK